jgi:spore germination protein KA
MNILSIVLNLLTYKEPAKNDRFELLEDEPEEICQAVNKDAAQSMPIIGIKGKWKSGLYWRLREKSNPQEKENQSNAMRVDKKLNKNLKTIKTELNFPTNQDVVIREFKIMQQYDAFIVYMDGMADKTTINDYILRQLMTPNFNKTTRFGGDLLDCLVNNLLSVNQVTKQAEYDQIIKQLLNGLTALFVENIGECILIESRGFDKRNVSNPLTETIIKGPHEAFIENLRTNITLVRKIIRNKNLVTEILPTGKTNNATCAIMYIKGIVNPKIVRELKRRINSIDIDQIQGDGTLDQLIEDHPFSLFPQILSTERPDRTAYFLMEGKVALICDGTPYASVVPATFFDMFHSSEDYALRWQYGTFLRIVRMIAACIAVFLPGMYVALTLFHHEMIPTELLSSLAKAREHLPFPTIIEILLMEISFELIREAGIRVPGVIGQTLGIIGAIILGQAAVAAGLVSPVLIIVISITGLGSFAIPNFSLAFGVRISRFIFIACGAIAGFYGIAAGIFIFGGLACSMKSFGVPYFSPIAPKTESGRDIIIRMPTWMQKMRPDYLNTRNRTRMGKAVRGWPSQDKTGDGNDQGR